MREFRSGGLPRSAVVLIALVLATQAVAAFSDSARRPILFVSLLLLDGLGAVYSWKAARHGEARLTWRLAAAGRAFSLSSTITFAVDAVHSGSGWWWSGVGCGLAMFVSLTASAVSMSTHRLRGAQRWAFMAEVGTVLSSGFMVVWYFVLGDAMHGPATSHWIYKLGYPLGNLLLLSAVSAVLLRGAVARLSQPLALLLAGMFAYAIGDVAFTALVLESERPSASTPAAAGLVFSSLVLTVAAMRRSAQGPVEPAGPEPAQMPAWSGQLPYVAVGVGSLLMLVAMVRQHMPPIWSGLTIAQTVMTAALAVRQVISLRDSRRLNGADALTGLANVTGLQGALDRSIRARPGPALLLIDLDGFKQINDGYGHAVGDKVLVEFARLVRGAIRRGDVAARVGGDEFVVLLAGIESPREAVTVAERVLTALTVNPVRAGRDEIVIRASIGIATAGPEETAQELQRHADLAMYESKRSGAHGWRLYEPSMTDRRTRDTIIGDKLLPGLADGQYEILYQPLVDMATSAPRGVEALLRWTHPTLGPVSPAEFVPIAERTGAIVPLGLWVLEESCTQVRQWRHRHPGLYASVNVSAKQLLEPTFIDDVLGVLSRTGLPAEALNLEITETAVVDEDVAIPALAALREHGIRVSVDDFGTGYSSLHYLTRLPVDVLKIDRSFVAELDSTARGAAVAEAIIRLAQVLGLATVAEGVETAAQAAELQMLGCQTAQGYLFAKPMTVSSFDSTYAAVS